MYEGEQIIKFEVLILLLKKKSRSIPIKMTTKQKKSYNIFEGTYAQ